jgi:hypothetical protein
MAGKAEESCNQSSHPPSKQGLMQNLVGLFQSSFLKSEGEKIANMINGGKDVVD